MEAAWMKQFTSFGGTCCDVGCSTGEFLSTIEWKGQKFGMEINPVASTLAESTGIDFSRSILTEESFFDAGFSEGQFSTSTNLSTTFSDH